MVVSIGSSMRCLLVFRFTKDWRVFCGNWKLGSGVVVLCVAVLRIRIHRIHMFLGLLDPDSLVRCLDPDPDPSIIKGSG